jgi:hypothetical protein
MEAFILRLQTLFPSTVSTVYRCVHLCALGCCVQVCVRPGVLCTGVCAPWGAVYRCVCAPLGAVCRCVSGVLLCRCVSGVLLCRCVCSPGCCVQVCVLPGVLFSFLLVTHPCLPAHLPTGRVRSWSKLPGRVVPLARQAPAASCACVPWTLTLLVRAGPPWGGVRWFSGYPRVPSAPLCCRQCHGLWGSVLLTSLPDAEC